MLSDRLSAFRANLQANRTLATAIVRFLVFSQAGTLAVLALFYMPSDASRWADMAAWSLVGLAGTLVLVLWNIRLCRSRDGFPALKLGAANKLTLFRFVLIVPLVALIAHGRLAIAGAVYLVSGLSDVADGIVARRRGEQTQFGVMMDPTADIFTTTGVFATLYARGLLPWWVLAVLLFRYVSLGVGSIVLIRLVGPIEFKATRTGKIVGVLQAAAVMLIVVLTSAGLDWRERLGPFLYPFLALIFGAVIVSKLVIAIRHLRRGAAYARSEG